jgi:hypothetical protein
MLPAASPVRRSAVVMPSRRPQAGNTPAPAALRPAPSLSIVALVALNVAAIAVGPLVLVRPVPAGAEDLARLTGLLAALAVLGGAIALTRAGVVSRVLVSALLAGTAATAVHVAAYTALGTAGRSPADFWSLGAAAVAGTVVAVWLGRTAVSGPASSPVVLGGLAAANAVAAAVLGAVFLGAGQA